MKWITKDEVKEAAKDKMTALECSLKHHQQGRDCTRGELVDAIDSGDFELNGHSCACCVKFDQELCQERDKGIEVCPLSDDDNPVHCCGGIFMPTRTALDNFEGNPGNDNLKAFQQAESKVCDYIQQAIDEAVKEKERLQAEPEVVKCEVFEAEQSLQYISARDGSQFIAFAPNDPDFIGFEYANQNISISPRLFEFNGELDTLYTHGPDCNILTPTHVLFRKS